MSLFANFLSNEGGKTEIEKDSPLKMMTVAKVFRLYVEVNKFELMHHVQGMLQLQLLLFSNFCYHFNLFHGENQIVLINYDVKSKIVASKRAKLKNRTHF